MGTKCSRDDRKVTKADGQVRSRQIDAMLLAIEITHATAITFMQKMAEKFGMPFFEVDFESKIDVEAPFFRLTRQVLGAKEFRYRCASDSWKCVNCHAPSEPQCKCKERVRYGTREG